MIDKTRIIDTVRQRLEKLPSGHYLDIRTYKRNRSVIIVKLADDDLLVIENGYSQDQFHLKPEKLEKALKTLLDKEFPRSHKVRLYTMGDFLEKEALDIRRKII